MTRRIRGVNRLKNAQGFGELYHFSLESLRSLSERGDLFVFLLIRKNLAFLSQRQEDFSSSSSRSYSVVSEVVPLCQLLDLRINLEVVEDVDALHVTEAVIQHSCELKQTGQFPRQR